MIVRDQSEDGTWNGAGEFRPLGGMLMNSMVTHGAEKEAHEAATVRDTKPEKVDDLPFYIFLLETENMMRVTEFGEEVNSKMNPGVAKKKAKL